jgi:hypothetical protein
LPGFVNFSKASIANLTSVPFDTDELILSISTAAFFTIS